MNKVLGALLLVVILAPLAYADQGSFANSGGSTSVSSGVTITNSPVASPAGTVNLSCPQTTTGACAGGSFSFVASDGTTLAASFTSGKFAEGCSGGGRGGHVTCSYTFTGYFSGSLTAGGETQGIIGVTYQAFGTGGKPASGTSGYNSAYAPFYYSDSGQILRSDDLMGTNQITYGSQGSGVGNFYGAYGIALDSSGRIYVADTYNCRVVRIDDMLGTNWTTYPSNPTCGAGQGQFYDPNGIAVDSNGKIYVMDTGNARLVSIDDMTGKNWTTFGSVGSGTNQLSSFTSVAVDSANNIYVADAGNLRIVRMADMQGTNWTVLTQSPPVNGVSSKFVSPVAVAVDAAGKIYVADNWPSQPAVVRVDDMTGANWTSIYTGSNSGGLNSISVDSGGTVFTGGGGVHLVDNQAAVLSSSGAVGPVGSYYVFGVTPVPVSNPHPPAIAFTPPSLTISQNLGGTSAPQNITVSNLGGGTLNINSASTNSPFAATDNCSSLAGGASCAISVTFTPTVAGAVNDTLTIDDNSDNLGAAQSIALTGNGTAPAATVTPSSLNFPSQVVGTISAPKSVTVQSTGTGPLQVTNITTAAPFSQGNNCTGALAPGALCTIQVSFTPTGLGSVPGTLTITDNAGTQVVNLSGRGSGPVSLSPTELDFGTVGMGTISAPQTVTLTNSGSTSVTGVTIGASAGFAIASTTCGTTVGAGANCTIDVTFAPTGLGSVDGTLTVTDSALGSPQMASLAGIGGVATVTPTATATATPTATASATATVTATATNTETATATATPTATTTSSATTTATATATPSATATVTASATNTATATATDTATPTTTASSTATPTATPTTSMAVTASLAFGNVAVGQTPTKTLTVYNTGAIHPLVVSSAVPSDPSFALSGTGTCGALPVTLAPSTNCTLGVTFTPAAVGAHNATLTLTDNTTASPQSVTLSGAGIAGLVLTSSHLTYGSVRFGLSGVSSLAVINYQTQPVSLSESFSGANAADFSVTGGTCTSTLAANSSCSLVVTFKPGALGTESATMSISDSPDPLGPYTVALSTGPTIPDTEPITTMAFSNVVQSTTRTFTFLKVTNASPFPLTLSEGISGPNAADFAVASVTSCAGSTACVIPVSFTASTETAESATLTINVSNDPSSPHVVALTGTGTTPVLLSPASTLAFGTITRPNSKAMTITVVNEGTATLTIPTPILSGANPADFLLTTAPAKPCGSTLAGGAYCLVGVTFKPSVAGAESASIAISAGPDAASPHNVGLTGTGM